MENATDMDEMQGVVTSTEADGSINAEVAAHIITATHTADTEEDHYELFEIDNVVGHELDTNTNLIFLLEWNGMEAGEALWKKSEAELQNEAPVVVARYWDAYNKSHGWRGDGWRPCDRLAPYSSYDVKRRLYHPLRIHSHDTEDGGATYDILVEWLRWPAQRDWTVEPLSTMAGNRAILKAYVTATLKRAGALDLEQKWWGGTMRTAMDEMERRLEEKYRA